MQFALRQSLNMSKQDFEFNESATQQQVTSDMALPDKKLVAASDRNANQGSGILE